jgi:hypothetical protein
MDDPVYCGSFVTRGPRVLASFCDAVEEEGERQTPAHRRGRRAFSVKSAFLIEDPKAIVILNSDGYTHDFNGGPQPGTRIRIGFADPPTALAGVAGLIGPACPAAARCTSSPHPCGIG